MPVYELLGDKGSVPQPKLDQLARYEAALELYRTRKFGDALQSFEALEKEGDTPASTMAGRCRHYQDHPPPDDWDGSHHMETK